MTPTDHVGSFAATNAEKTSNAGSLVGAGGDFDSLLRSHLQALPALSHRECADQVMTDTTEAEGAGAGQPTRKRKKKKAKRQSKRILKNADEWLAAVNAAGAENADDGENSLSYQVLPRPPELLYATPDDFPSGVGDDPGEKTYSPTTGDTPPGDPANDVDMVLFQSSDEVEDGEEPDDGVVASRPGGTCLRALNVQGRAESESDSSSSKKRSRDAGTGTRPKRIKFSVVDPCELAKMALVTGGSIKKPPEADGATNPKTKKRRKAKRKPDALVGGELEKLRVKSIKVCVAYEKFRKCPRGDACPFLHQLPGMRSVQQPNEIVPEEFYDPAAEGRRRSRNASKRTM